jgi:hypothetical protein
MPLLYMVLALIVVAAALWLTTITFRQKKTSSRF